MSARSTTRDTSSVIDELPTRQWVLYVVVSFMFATLLSLFFIPMDKDVYGGVGGHVDVITKYGQWMGTGAILWVVPSVFFGLYWLVKMNNKLMSFNIRWLEWSLFGTKANISVTPLNLKQRKHIGIVVVYTLLLLYSVPLVAYIEEWLFRGMVGAWFTSGESYSPLSTAILTGLALVWAGLVFGMVHMFALVTVRMGLCLSVFGAALLGIYLVAGLWGAVAFHITHNLVVIAWSIFELRLKDPLRKLLSNETRRVYIDRHVPTIAGWADKWVQPENIGVTN
jgi:hypothetical protein